MKLIKRRQEEKGESIDNNNIPFLIDFVEEEEKDRGLLHEERSKDLV